jgi:hypothetical protein
MDNKPKKTVLFIYNFVGTQVPTQKDLEFLKESGLMLQCVLSNKWHYIASFITHRQAKSICERAGLVATRFRRISLEPLEVQNPVN